jgi:metal-sulfur cluster biosynthetic enzyme
VVGGEAAGVSTTQQIADRLNEIIDPCSAAAGAPAGLVDMGLIRSLEVVDGEVTVVVRVTHPSCMMAPIFLAKVQQLANEVPGVTAIHASLDTGFDWTEADMTPEYRERLKLRRARARPPRARPSTPASRTPSPSPR